MRENPPNEPQFDKLVRSIAANEPRVTKFKINWDSSATAAANAAADAQTMSETNGVTSTGFSQSCDTMNDFMNNRTEIAS